ALEAGRGASCPRGRSADGRGRTSESGGDGRTPGADPAVGSVSRTASCATTIAGATNRASPKKSLEIRTQSLGEGYKAAAGDTVTPAGCARSLRECGDLRLRVSANAS